MVSILLAHQVLIKINYYLPPMQSCRGCGSLTTRDLRIERDVPDVGTDGSAGARIGIDDGWGCAGINGRLATVCWTEQMIHTHSIGSVCACYIMMLTVCA